MRLFFIIGTIERITAGTFNAIDIIYVFKIRNRKGALTKMCIDRVKFFRKICIVSTAAANRSNTIKIVVIFQNRRQVKRYLNTLR